MRIDSHQHFWKLSRGDYGWLTPEFEPLFRDFLPEDLLPKLKTCDVDQTILVQAAPTIDETRFLLELAGRHEFIAGVVGWVDFGNPDAEAHIRELSRDPKLVGLRPMIQDIADDDWMLRKENEPAYRCMIEENLVFDALVLPRHLPNLQTLVQRFPALRVIIDHGAKPPIREKIPDSWFSDMASLSTFPQISCKVSGLVTEAAPEWTREDLEPVIQHLLERFGPDRLLWGSDWPVLEMAGKYEEWFQVSQIAFQNLTEPERQGIFGDNAKRLYLNP
ncbi:MAG: amidohydrolase family protein [Verrucomicrobiota bacterium]